MQNKIGFKKRTRTSKHGTALDHISVNVNGELYARIIPLMEQHGISSHMSMLVRAPIAGAKMD